MRSKARLYSVPVIACQPECYRMSTFTTEIDLKNEVHEVVVSFTAELHNVELQELVDKGRAEYVCHVECTKTCYRNAFTTNNAQDTFYIEDQYLDGNIEVSTYLVSAEDIAGFTSNDFSPDYAGLSFELQKGLIIGIGKFRQFTLQKQDHALYDSPSIFSIVTDFDERHQYSRIEYSGDKICIVLPKKAVKRYQVLTHAPQYRSVLYSMLLLPALMEVFAELKTNGSQDYIDKHWYQSMDATYKGIGTDLEHALLDDPYIAAQKLLGNTLIRGLEQLTVEESGNED